jgi:hypothetical protein
MPIRPNFGSDGGLPDANRSSNLGKFWMEAVGIFYGRLVFFTANWYLLCPFGIFMVNWYVFPNFGILTQEKSGNPGLTQKNASK